MYVNPQVASVLSSAAGGVIKALPTQHLTRLGLTRGGAALAPLPLAGAFVGGAVLTLLTVPSTRTWAVDQTRSLYRKVKGSVQQAEETAAEVVAEKVAPEGDLPPESQRSGNVAQGVA